MGAIGGLAEQPIQSMHNSDSLLKGFSKGLIGLVTKPVGAVAELVNQTGQSILRITGTARMPTNELRMQRRALNKEFARYSISITKCLWKIIAQTHGSIYIHAMIEATAISNENKTAKSGANSGKTHLMENLTACYLMLSDDILYIIDKNEDMLLRAFYISQVDLSIKSSTEQNDVVGSAEAVNDASLLVVTLHNERTERFISEYQRLYENTMDRLVEFVTQASVANKTQTKQEESRLDNEKEATIGEHMVVQLDDPILNETASHKLTLRHQPSFLMFNYYKYTGLAVYEHLSSHNSLPCVCGSLMRTIDLTLSQSKGNNQILAMPQQQIINVGNTELEKNNQKENLNNSIEMPKIHKVINKNFTSRINNESYEVVASNDNRQQVQQKYCYYVEPKLSINFISTFNSLKRKASNKGFQF
jgi:hypothetical protein